MYDNQLLMMGIKRCPLIYSMKKALDQAQGILVISTVDDRIQLWMHTQHKLCVAHPGGPEVRKGAGSTAHYELGVILE